MRRTKGFTLVELLVVIAIIALLMGILMPALARVRAIAFRMTCGTNLAGIGKAIMIYANDYEEEFPAGGWPKSTLITQDPQLADWAGSSRATAFGPMPTTSTPQATMTSCLYVLVKFADVTPKSFVCKGDTGVTEFTLADHGSPVDASGEPLELVDVWDFGESEDQFDKDYGADAHCSYTYHIPYCDYPLSTASEPSMPVAADPNPWFWHAGTRPKTTSFPGQVGEEGPYGSKAPFDDRTVTDRVKFGNSYNHQEEGQNVLFADASVSFEKVPFCGIEEDNIYTLYDGDKWWQGNPTANAKDEALAPWGRKDAFLIGNMAAEGE